MEERYPPVLNEDLDHPKFSNFEWVNLKNDTQAQALEKKPFFDPHRHNSQFGKNENVTTPDSYYFRLTTNGHLYYTETDSDTIVLAGMDPKRADFNPNNKE